MTNEQYRIALQKLELYTLDCAEVLGVSRRQAQRYAKDATIPGPVAKLLLLMVRDVVSPSDVEGLE